MREAPPGPWLARPTVVLAVLAATALAVALAAREPATSGAGPTSSPTTDPGLDLDPGLVAAARDRIEAIEQPLTTWLRLADCESGEWDADATPVIGSADWTHGSDEDTRFQGGLHFTPGTWDEFREPGMAPDAGDAALLAQVVVAERVLDDQGWSAWPVCSRKLDLR